MTPAEKLVDDDLTYASVPAWDGLFGVLPQRAPLLARLGMGELKIVYANRAGATGGERSFLVDGGFVKMADNSLTILAERAIPGEQLSLSEAEAELAEARARVVPPDANDQAAAQAALRRDRDRAELKVRLAKSTRAKGI
ncbi:MAG: F0F1 ATP synthase subunit epsilon [Phycisphaerales bacterium]|nr:F0F1 ATP synthase subunit epsilon [Phycisphaerales bacterium]